MRSSATNTSIWLLDRKKVGETSHVIASDFAPQSSFMIGYMGICEMLSTDFESELEDFWVLFLKVVHHHVSLFLSRDWFFRGPSAFCAAYDGTTSRRRSSTGASSGPCRTRQEHMIAVADEPASSSRIHYKIFSNSIAEGARFIHSQTDRLV